MPILDAAVAFALTMLAVATAATQIVQLIQYFAEKRGEELSKMLQDYFTQELETVVNRGLERAVMTCR